MSDAPVGTPAERAAKIMGRSCIQIEEVLKVFPEATTWVKKEDYQMTPFNARLLFRLSERRRLDYILFPAIPLFLTDPNYQLNPARLENILAERFPEVIINAESFYRVSAFPLTNKSFVPARWYLLSARVLKLGTTVQHPKLGTLPWKIERSLIYMYAWYLFWKLRSVSVFNGKNILCSDYYSNKTGTNTVIHFSDLEVLIQPNNPKLKSDIGIVPSVVLYEQKENP